MVFKLAFTLGMTLFVRDASALRLFSKPARPMHMRAARVDDTSFVVLNGKLYRNAPGGALINVSRWPHVSKIASFGHALVALSYAGELTAWTRAADGAWAARPLSPIEFVDFSATHETLVAIDRSGHAHLGHPAALEDESTGLRLAALPEYEGLDAVDGFSSERGFAISGKDSARVLLDPAGMPCARLLGVR